MTKEINQQSAGISQHSVKDLLGGAVNYLIPMYQRNYAWGDGEINQLIQDVLDEVPRQSSADGFKPYYIGTLVASRRPSNDDYPIYEVIDGQQRLTTLFLLASYLLNSNEKAMAENLSWFSRPCIHFESRPNSSNALLAAFEGHLANDSLELKHGLDYNSDIINGYQSIQRLTPKLCKENNLTEQRLSDYLFNQVQIMRVQVPDDTNLNHYFEIMNSRGEQLEKHEVLKSKLMSVLDEKDYPVLHSIWEACANMERYVQMGFNPQQRDMLFGKNNWNQFLPKDFNDVAHALLSDDNKNSKTTSEAPLTLSQLTLQRPLTIEKNSPNPQSEEEAPERFNTVVNFPNFLLQVLRAISKQNIPLDDKRLITVFEEHILKKPDAKTHVKNFIYQLLKAKYLFDQYIIKREFSAGNDHWSLKCLKWQSSNNSSYYVNTFGVEDSDSDTNRKVLMLLSALHVSTPTMVYKHWLNGALSFLLSSQNVDSVSYLNYLESMTRCFVYDRFLATGKGLDYYEIIYERNATQKTTNWSEVDQSKLLFGKIDNNLVFNYLDYLLWLEYRKNDAKVRDYEFSFRSSVEHFYPQNPISCVDKLQDDSLHSFGNLCLISHSKNSRLSNLSPEEKKKSYQKGGIDSIKQWLMMQQSKWTEIEINRHNKEMLNVLAEDLDTAAKIQHNL